MRYGYLDTYVVPAAGTDEYKNTARSSIIPSAGGSNVG